MLLATCYLLLNTGCAYLGYLKGHLEDIPNFHQVDQNLYRGGLPTEEGLEQLKKLGIKTVISLRGEDEETLRQKELTSELGMDFLNIPLSVYQMPEDEKVLLFLDTVIDQQKQPVFLHCTDGRDRTGAMVAMYRVVVGGWTIKEAYKEAKRLGFWPYHGQAQLHRFIHQLKDKEIYFERVGREVPR